LTSADPLLETQMFWTRYQRPIMLGLVAALVVLAVFGGYRLYTMRRDAAGAARLASAKSAADYQKVIADYPGSPAAPTAAILLATEERKEEKFAEANTTLQTFIKQHPKHELITTAKMAMAANLESLGKADEALEPYRRIAAEHPRDFNAPAAMISQVHFLKQKGQVDEARRVCETVLTQYRDSYTAQEASQLLRTLKPSAPAAAAPQSSPAATPAPQNSPAATPTSQSSPAATPTPQG
jgi:TolA-binding protein